MLFSRFLDRSLRSGRITIIDWRGDAHHVGPPNAPHAGTVRVTSPAVPRRMLMGPTLAFGEAYMRGEVLVDDDKLIDVLELIVRDIGIAPRLGLAQLHRAYIRLMGPIHQLNTRLLAKRNIARHYDLDADFYASWLDDEMHYSCAFFARPDMTLEEAQDEKARRIAAKLALRPGDRVLDIGCGWGAMARHLAREHDVTVTGISLSREQLKVAERRSAEAGLSSRTRFEYADYREHKGRYDRIVSVGMLEHVGAPNMSTYFKAVSKLLKDDGVALIHTIGQVGPPAPTSPWIRKHIFPGGYIPSLSEVAATIEPEPLFLTDVETLRLHYAKTLRKWSERFAHVRNDAVARYGEEFARMWEFYLAASEVSFTGGVNVNYQVQLTKSLEALPLSREYMTPAEPTPVEEERILATA